MKNLGEKTFSLAILFTASVIIHFILVIPFGTKGFFTYIFVCFIALAILLTMYFYNNKISSFINNFTASKEAAYISKLFVSAVFGIGIYYIGKYYNDFSILLNKIDKDEIDFFKIFEINLINSILAFSIQFIYYIMLYLFYDRNDYPEEKSSFREHFLFLITVPTIMTIIFLL